MVRRKFSPLFYFKSNLIFPYFKFSIRSLYYGKIPFAVSYRKIVADGDIEIFDKRVDDIVYRTAKISVLFTACKLSDNER